MPRPPHECGFSKCRKPEPDIAIHECRAGRQPKRTKPFVWVSYKASFLGLYNYCKSARGTWLRARNVMHGYSNYDQLRGKHIRNSDPSRFIGAVHPVSHGGPGKEMRHSRETHRWEGASEVHSESHSSCRAGHGRTSVRPQSHLFASGTCTAGAVLSRAQEPAVPASQQPSVQADVPQSSASAAAYEISGIQVPVGRVRALHGGGIESGMPVKAPMPGMAASAASQQGAPECAPEDAPAQSAPPSVISNSPAPVQAEFSRPADNPGPAVKCQPSKLHAEQCGPKRSAPHSGRLSAIHSPAHLRHRLHLTEICQPSATRGGGALDGREAKPHGNGRENRAGRCPRGRPPPSIIYMASRGTNGRKPIHPKVVSSADAFPQ